MRGFRICVAQPGSRRLVYDASRYAPGSGDLQGDSAAPQKFARAYDKVVEPALSDLLTFREEQALFLFEPLIRKVVNCGHARFADDLTTLGLANSAKQALWRQREWDRQFALSCHPIGLHQNLGKRQITFRFAGVGQLQNLLKLLQSFSKPVCPVGFLMHPSI